MAMSTRQYYREFRFAESNDRITWAVQRLIIANSLVFAAQLLLDIPLGAPLSAGMAPGGIVEEVLAFQPVALLMGGVWKPLTYMFLHGGLQHLFFNMLWLFFFGPEVERTLGTRQFFRFYVVCGAVGVLATFVPALLYGTSQEVVGASGAVMGVLVAYAMVNPEREFFLFPLPIPINARALVVIVVALNVVMGMNDSGVSVATHFGGMAVGFLYMKAVPLFREWQRRQWRAKRGGAEGAKDHVGEAVDNIFKFEDRKRR